MYWVRIAFLQSFNTNGQTRFFICQKEDIYTIICNNSLFSNFVTKSKLKYGKSEKATSFILMRTRPMIMMIMMMKGNTVDDGNDEGYNNC